ncbi:MAG TPA: glycosyl transferase family 4 [Rhodanobacteraceae bacterium]|nr:glycosyl transferase family 4 [Rhodanobacteraceae bacterium]
MMIGVGTWAVTMALALAALMVSAALTLAVERYARIRLLDLPGRRRSHARPTPRGGGLGFVVALLAFALAPALATDPFVTSLLGAAVIAVAASGFWDDHRPLPASSRLAVQVLAAALTLVALRPTLGAAEGTVMAWLVTGACGIALIWSMNLHNFMDGIDGLLGLQVLFVCAVIAAAAHLADAPGLRLLGMVGAAAVAGFLPFNFPRARVFMGDIGSGVLGLWVGVLLLLALGTHALSPSAAALLVSAFAIDATLTLFARVVRGRRWYSAHREHLYQWLVRCGHSHAGVAGLYMMWNLLIVVPATIVAMRLPPGRGWPVALVVYAGGVVLWWWARHRCLAAVRFRGPRHVAA